MSKVFLHDNKKYNSLIIVFLLLFIPFALYGFYKNGIVLYNEGLINMFMMFKPLLFLVISIICSFVFSKITKKEFLDYPLLGNILISLITFSNTSIILFVIILIIVNVLYMFFKHNIVALYMLLLTFASWIFKSYTYLNLAEKTLEHKYSFLDYILGKGYGGISNTLLIMSIVSLIVLICFNNYKKHIALTSLITYYALTTILIFITNNPSLNLFMNNNIIFAYIFICPIAIFSPYTKGGCYIYGAVLGIFTVVYSFVDVNIGLYLGIFILSFLAPLFDNFITRKSIGIKKSNGSKENQDILMGKEVKKDEKI